MVTDGKTIRQSGNLQQENPMQSSPASIYDVNATILAWPIRGIKISQSAF
ncbi:hypothetical protein GM3709_3920 (plasmid) [Geminocystis sp. NIES-3709]|nr:hypothetical protein GM3709_3920 [Geminocystis sp. NIES-3709]